MSRHIPDHEIETIVNLYRSGQSACSIGRLIGRPTRTVTNWLNYLDVTRRSVSDSCRKHPLNQHAFSTIETEAQAYWLGFLTADCGISSHSDIRLNLQHRDVDHLERFRRFLQTPIPIRVQQHCVYFDLHSQQMCHDLAHYGIGPRKSKTVRWPALLPQCLNHHYARGVFDGDGTWCSLNRKGMIQWRLIGPQAFLLDFQSRMIESCQLRVTKLAAHHTTHDVAYLVYSGTPQVTRIFNWMYAESTLFLPRKKHIFTAYIEKFYPVSISP